MKKADHVDVNTSIGSVDDVIDVHLITRRTLDPVSFTSEALTASIGVSRNSSRYW